MQTDRRSQIKEYREDSSDVTVISARISKYKAGSAREIIASQLQRSQLRCQPSSQYLSADLSPGSTQQNQADAAFPCEKQQLATAACQTPLYDTTESDKTWKFNNTNFY